ncbi:MAG: transposase [Planctomycetota bacterium]|jgi:transposase-like protein
MKKKHTGTQIVAKLRQADVLIGQGKTVPEVCKEIEVSQHTYYRWRQKYGGMSPEMVKELRALQKENARLRKVVADQAIENAILKEVASISKKSTDYHCLQTLLSSSFYLLRLMHNLDRLSPIRSTSRELASYVQNLLKICPHVGIARMGLFPNLQTKYSLS